MLVRKCPAFNQGCEAAGRYTPREGSGPQSRVGADQPWGTVVCAAHGGAGRPRAGPWKGAMDVDRGDPGGQAPSPRKS